MKPLAKLFSSPVQLLDKARRDGESLMKVLADCDEVSVRDYIFNFSVSAYHICDWVKKFKPELGGAVNDLLNNSYAIGACRDLCNASKHVGLDLDTPSYQKYPPKVQDVDISARAAVAIPDLMEGLCPAKPQEQAALVPPNRKWRLKVQLKNGRRMSGEELVSETLAEWDDFFQKHDIR